VDSVADPGVIGTGCEEAGGPTPPASFVCGED
jgi:hypothetical protein